MLARTLRCIGYCFAKGSNSMIPTLSSMRTIKKADKDLQKLKRVLTAKEPVKSQTLYEEYHHTEVYKKIDTDLEAFFYKRDYNLENFNFLINLLGHQKKLVEVPEVLKKMSLMKIQPDERTFNYIIRAASHEGNVEAAENYLIEARERFGDSKYFYTSLMQVYVWKNDPEMSFKILQEMIEKGIQPDLPVYSSLVNAFRLGRKLYKCWELHRMVLKSKVELDEAYTGVMMKVYAASHDAELAVKLYREVIIGKNIKPLLQTINSYFKALSTRPEYSTQVIDKFLDMIESGDIINEETVRWALRACSTTANIKSAIEIIKIMKFKQIEPTVVIYNSLIRTYANGCLIPEITEKQRELMLADTWKLLQEVINKNMLDTPILNNVMLAYANALEDTKIQGLILPLYQKFNLQMDPYSYEVLINLNYAKKDFNTAIKVWQQMKLKLQEKKSAYMTSKGKHQADIDSMREDMRPTFNAMETYLQIGIRLMDMNMVLDALQMFKQLKRHPKNSTLKFLGNLKNLPIEIQASLMEFKIRFGEAKLAKVKANSERNVPDPQSL